MEQNFSRRIFLASGTGLITASFLQLLGGCRNQEPSTSTTSVNLDPRIELLNTALQHEFGSIVQYSNHCGLLKISKEKDLQEVASLLRSVIIEELNHAIELTAIIRQMKGEPSLAVWPPQTAENAKNMLKLDIASEQGAINLYRQILELDYSPAVKKTVNLILQAESKHAHAFGHILKQLEAS